MWWSGHEVVCGVVEWWCKGKIEWRCGGCGVIVVWLWCVLCSLHSNIIRWTNTVTIEAPPIYTQSNDLSAFSNPT